MILKVARLDGFDSPLKALHCQDFLLVRLFDIKHTELPSLDGNISHHLPIERLVNGVGLGVVISVTPV